MIRIPNFDSYTWDIEDNVLVLTPKITVLKPEELLEKDVSFCKIEECKIDDVILRLKKLRHILNYIWEDMGIQQIFRHTTFNFKIGDEGGERGYTYIPELKVSAQSKSAKDTLKEIFNMANVNSQTLYIKIMLKDERVYEVKN